MPMNPQKKARLAQLNEAVKAIIYKPERMQAFLKLLGTKEGAVSAVQTVLAAIEQRTRIEPEVYPLLAVNAYMLMVDVAQEVMQRKPSPEILREVIGILLKTTAQAGRQSPAQPAGMLAQGVM